MWPFEAKRRRSLAGLSTAAAVDVTATIVSANAVSGPFSGLCAALVWLEVTESMSLSNAEAKALAGSGAGLFFAQRVTETALGCTARLPSEGARLATYVASLPAALGAGDRDGGRRLALDTVLRRSTLVIRPLGATPVPASASPRRLRRSSHEAPGGA